MIPISKQVVSEVAKESVYMLHPVYRAGFSLEDFRLSEKDNQAEFTFFFINSFGERSRYTYIVSGNKSHTIDEMIVRLWTRFERTIRVNNECAKRYRGLE